MRKRTRCRLWAAGVLLLMLVTIGSAMMIHTELWTVELSNLPETFSDLRIALVSDLHGRTFGQTGEPLLEAVAKAQPDLIAVCGDAADAHTDVQRLSHVICGLCAIAPVYYVTGNHEWSDTDTDALLRQMEQWGAVVLRNEYVLLTRGTERLVLAGAEDPNGPADMETAEAFVQRIKEEQGAETPIVLLYHRNNALEQWAQLDVELVLSGHGHGGVVRLPLLGGLLDTDRSLFPDYSKGLYTQDGTTMAVSAGLGGLRLWNRPHLPILILKKQ